MKSGIFSLLALTCIACTLLPFAAVAQEVQVALDAAGSLTVITAETEQTLGLFPDYRGFQEAKLYRQPDGSFILEILYQPEDQVVRVRRPMTAAEVRELRRQVSARLADAPVRIELNQDGRPSLLRQALAYSFILYGPTLPVVLNVDDEGLASALYLSTAAAGFFVPFLLTRDQPVTRGMASLAGAGAFHGAVHGLGLALLAGGNETTGEAVLGAMTALSVTEAFLGYGTARRSSIGHGTAETIDAGGLWGTVLGLGLAGVLAIEADEGSGGVFGAGDAEDDVEANIRLFSGLGLLGSAAGLYGGYALAQTESYTVGDTRTLSTLATLGLYTGAAVATLAETDNGRVVMGLLTAGTAAGLVAGRVATRGRDFTPGQGALIGLSTTAGGLLGAAVAAAADAGDKATVTLSALGAYGGFAFMYLSYDREARAASTRMGWQLDVNPGGVLLSLAQSRGAAPNIPTPLFSLRRGL